MHNTFNQQVPDCNHVASTHRIIDSTRKRRYDTANRTTWEPEGSKNRWTKQQRVNSKQQNRSAHTKKNTFNTIPGMLTQKGRFHVCSSGIALHNIWAKTPSLWCAKQLCPFSHPPSRALVILLCPSSNEFSDSPKSAASIGAQHWEDSTAWEWMIQKPPQELSRMCIFDSHSCEHIYSTEWNLPATTSSAWIQDIH